MIMTPGSLQAALEEYPDLLQHALTRQYRARIALKKIKEQIEEAEANPDSDDGPEGITDEQKLRTSYDQKKAQLDLEVRRNPQKYGITKPTESAIRAVIQSDEGLIAIKEQLQQQERKRVEEFRSSRMMRLNRGREPKTTDSKLMAQLYEAEEESANADIEIQVLQETLETYRMLTAILLETNSAMSALDAG